ncbi:MAG: hypothetical protein AAGE85_13035, partial [Pseudomonadota bacterium]
MFYRIAICFALALASSTVVAEGDPDAYLETAAELIDPPFNLALVESDGAIADTTFITLSKNKPSKQSKQLSRLLKRAAREPVKLVVAGESSAKTAEVLRAALQILEGKELPHLELVFIGKPRHRERV